MNIFKTIVLLVFTSSSICWGMQQKPNDFQIKETTVVIVSSVGMLALASFIQWYFVDVASNDDSSLEPVLCYIGEWGKMFCNSVTTPVGEKIYVCYKK